ncbi:hypothetical protein WME75_13590 [Sorangium sp. So ce1014]|uniref:hypothetical protein n=1 Tax=Sorangium sp. So ce1014 TaxID=3133326 RepID=UPI003F5EA99E
MLVAALCLAGAFSFGAAAIRVAAAFLGSSALLFRAAVVFVVVARARGLDTWCVFVTHLPGGRDYPGVQPWEGAPLHRVTPAASISCRWLWEVHTPAAGPGAKLPGVT